MPILIFAIFFNKVSGNRLSKIILFYLVFDFLINLVVLGFLIPERYHYRVYPFFTFVESLFFAGLFFNVIKKQSLRKLVVAFTITFSISLVVYYYYSYFILNSLAVLDSIPIGIETILVFIFTFFYFCSFHFAPKMI